MRRKQKMPKGKSLKQNLTMEKMIRPSYIVECKGKSLELGRRTILMGIVNVTPDSFSDGGRFYDTDAAVSHALRLVEEGADILDIGGESTRPFSEPVPEDEELQRVVPVIEKIASAVDIPISVDTTKAEVARQALEAGASIINDVSALRFDSRMGEVAASFNAPVILMHMKGKPRTMQVEPVYQDLLKELQIFFRDAVERAKSYGLKDSKIIIDPGIGFGKTVFHNLLILKSLRVFEELKAPICIGTSRKSFIQRILSKRFGSTIKAQDPEAETGTQASLVAAVLSGAHIVRVHDVKKAVATTAIADAILNALPAFGSYEK